MSNTSQKNKELKAKDNKPTESAVTQIPNYGKCCTCKLHDNHPSMCRKTGKYCGRKQDVCESYKVK